MTIKQPKAMALDEDAELGLAMLIAEDEEGATEPIALPTTLGEARTWPRRICGYAWTSGIVAKTLASARTVTRSGPAALAAAIVIFATIAV